MSNNNFGYADNYHPVNNRPQASQSSHQNFPTSNATAAPYYGLQGADGAPKTYASTDYQYGQYRQSGASSTNNDYNWNQYNTSTGAGADSTSGLEPVEQRLVNATRAPAQNAYDSGLANLGYGSSLTYGAAAETTHPASDYSGANLYSGAAQTTAAQRNTQYDQAQARPVATAQRVTHVPASKGQRQAVETTPRTNTTASYNLPTPSPTYPQGLINSYPGNVSAHPIARTTGVPNARTSGTSTAQSSAQQPSYTQTTSYGYTQQGRASRMSPEQMRKTQTPTPPVPPIRMATPETRTNTYGNQASYPQQPVQKNQGQNSRDNRARAQPTQVSALNKAPVNVIMPSVGQPQASPKRAPAGQRDLYQPQQSSTAATQAARTGNFRSDPSRASAMYQQPQSQGRSEPAHDQATSVDPSLVYNRYHEYQQQIKEAEAEAARLAKIEEDKKAAEEAEKRKAGAARLQKEAEAARIEKQRKQQEAKAAREAKAAEKARKKQEAEAAAAASAAAVEAAQTLAESMHHQTNFGMNAPQEVQAGEGEQEEEYMEVQAGDDQDDDYVNEEKQRQPQTSYHQQRGTPAHKPILPPGYQAQPTPQSRAPPQNSMETPANDDDLTAMMEEEMRKTVERLRDFQAKDPKLFLKVWSSVRKSGGPEKSPQHNSEGSQQQPSPALGNAQPPLSYSAGPLSQGNTHQNDAAAPENFLSAPPQVPKKKPGRKPKKALEAQPPANQNQLPQPQSQLPPNQNFAGFADEIQTGEVLAPGDSIMIQRGSAQLPRKRKPGRPSNVEKALRELEEPKQPPQPKRKPGRPKGSRTKSKPADGEVHGEPPMAAPPSPPMQPSGPGSFGRLVPAAPLAGTAVRGAFDQQRQQSLPSNNVPMRSMSRISNATPASTPNADANTAQLTQQRAMSGTPQSATTATLAQAKAAPIAPAGAQSQTVQWPDEHIDLIAETGSKLLNSLPQNAGKTMEATTIRDMLRTNPSYVQVCEMIERNGFYMDRSKFARTLLAVISPSHPPPPPKPQGQQSAGQPAVNAGPSHQAESATGERSLSSGAAAMRAHKQAVAAGTRQPTSPNSAAALRPYNAYQPPKYGGVESGTRPLEPGSFVREDTAHSQSGPAKPAAAEKGKYASPYQSLRPEEDDFIPPPLDDDNDRDQHQLGLLQAYNKSDSTSYQTPHAPQQNGTTFSSAGAQNTGQTSAQGTYLGNGIWANSDRNSESTPQHQKPYPYQSQFSSHDGPASAPGRPPQLTHIVPSHNTPFRSITPARPWNTSEAGQKRPHSEAFGANRPFGSQMPSSYRPKPWGDRINSASETGARAPNPFGASPFRVSSATPQPQMPTQGTQKTIQAIYSQPYLQINSIEEVQYNPQQAARNPLLNFEGIVLPIDASIARRRSRYNPKTIARDVLISTGRHPTERSLNAHLEVLKNFKSVDNQSDLSTFRWDIVDPGGDEVGSFNKELREKAAAANMAAKRARGAVPTRASPFGLSSKPNKPSGLRNETIEIEDDDAMDVDGDDAPKGPSQSVRASKGGTQTSGRRPGREARNPAPNYKGMTAAELRGLKHDAGRRVREDSEQTPSEAAKKPRDGLKYVKFGCRWEGCDRVLLNLDTLRRHVTTIHGNNDDVVQQGKVCMWHGCGNKNYSPESEETPGTFFDNVKLFKKHMEDTHLKAVASLYGDGPKSDVYENDSDFDSTTTSSFLLDSDGRQVTPSVSGQQVERGNATHLNAARMKKLRRQEMRKDLILDFWNIEHFEHQPLKLDTRKSTGGLGKEATARFIAAQRTLEKEYGAELAEAAKMNEGLLEASRKHVYAHDMPKERRERLVVE